MNRNQLRHRLKIDAKEDLSYETIAPLIVKYTREFGVDYWIRTYVERNADAWTSWNRRHENGKEL